MARADRPIAYGRQSIDDSDLAAVAAALRSDYLTTGPAVEAFESDLTRHTGARHAVAVSSGTGALHVLYAALGLGRGDTLVVPAITFVATASAAELLGCRAVFADVDPDTGLMEPQHAEEALRRAPNVRAVVAVHLNGQSCDLSGLAASARTSGVPLLEDACHAIGGDEWRSGRGAAGEKGGPAASRIGACSEGLAACFSFHPVKTITTCEGGAVTTNDPVLADRMRLLRNHGLRREPAAGEGWPADAKGRPLPWYYRLDEPGFNYRLSDVQCALGQAQLARLDAFVSERRRLAARYDRLLAPLRERVVPIARPSPVATAWHLYPVLCKGGAEERADLYHHLKARNILAQVHYVPVTSHPYYRRSLDGAVFPGAQSYYDRVLSLPLYAGLAESDQDRVVDALTGFFR